LELPAHNGFSLPNFPDFRLYDLPGSPCDTLNINGPLSAGEQKPKHPILEIYPNPATEQVFFFIPEGEGFSTQNTLHLKITDVAGRMVFHSVWMGGALQVNQYPPGLYIATLQQAGGKQWTGKFIKI